MKFRLLPSCLDFVSMFERLYELETAQSEVETDFYLNKGKWLD